MGNLSCVINDDLRSSREVSEAYGNWEGNRIASCDASSGKQF
jgi:hypothetical protein